MKKLTSIYSEHRLLRSRGTCRGVSPGGAQGFTAFAPTDYADASVARMYDRSRRARAVADDLPDNVVRFAASRSSLRQA